MKIIGYLFPFILAISLSYVFYRIISKEIEKRRKKVEELLRTEKGQKQYKEEAEKRRVQQVKLIKVFFPISIIIYMLIFICGVLGIFLFITSTIENGINESLFKDRSIYLPSLIMIIISIYGIREAIKLKKTILEAKNDA